jgi:hypothetical protein
VRHNRGTNAFGADFALRVTSTNLGGACQFSNFSGRDG